MREAASPDDTAPPRSIPAARTSLIGRAGALATLRAMLLSPAVRLLTITGVGGSGKTRLAQALAADVLPSFDGNVCWVALAPIGSGALVPQAIAVALGVLETPETPVLDVLISHLGDHRCLLVLDNCEHLLDACAETAEHLLSACPDLCILATSREPLMIAGERQWRAPPLNVPSEPAPFLEPGTLSAELERADAVRLFVERAQAVASDFQLTAGNASAVATICIRLEGIPLALELAAARVRVLSVHQILAHLDDVFRLLSGGSRVAPTRQQTLQATLDWSYDLLTVPEQCFFRRLAVFAGGFDLEAAEYLTPPAPLLSQGRGEPHSTVGGSSSSVRGMSIPTPPPIERTPPSLRGKGAGGLGLDLLTRLIDKSLVSVEDGGMVARYRLLEPVRQYAQHHLDAQGETDDARAQHEAYFLALAERAAPELRGPDQVAWLQRLASEQDNFRAALHRAFDRVDAIALARLAIALAPFWEVSGGMSEGRRWLDAVPDAASPLPAALQLQALLAAGRLAFWQADLIAATARLDAACALARQLDDRQAIAEALTWLGTVRRRQGAVADAARLLDQSLPLHEGVGDQPGAAWAVFMQGMLASDDRDFPRAIRLIEESLGQYRTLGDVRFIGIVGTMLGSILVMSGEVERVAGLLRESLAGFRAVGDRAFMLSGLLTLAWVEAKLGRPVRAARLLGAAETLRNTLGARLPPVNQDTLNATLAIIRPQLGEGERAAAEADGRSMTLDQAIAESMNLGGPQSRPAAAVIPSGALIEPLTQREREVAVLLAQGASDREIAEALTIAVSTAGVHVRNIRGKLGLNSRWQVADWAIANGLASAPAD
ncbi:MAG: LuxR C-terminal-related transcriptional regulator [Dehalococcoidia bacterium]